LIDLENKLNEIKGRIFSLFQTPIEDLLKNKFQMMVQLQVPTTVVNTWYYWEYEQYVRLLNEKNKEEMDQQEKQNKEQNEKYSGMSFDPSKYMNKYNPSSVMKNFSGMGSNSAFPRI
jgi:hypothetical protein